MALSPAYSRTGPRFQINMPARLCFLGTQEPAWDCKVINMSGTGVRFVARKSLPLDRTIGLEFGEHLLVARVRNFRKHGDKYAIGARRIHTVNKLDLEDEKTSVEQVWEKMEESQGGSCAAIESTPDDGAALEPIEATHIPASDSTASDSVADRIEAADIAPNPNEDRPGAEILTADQESELEVPLLSVDSIVAWPAVRADGPAAIPEFVHAGSIATPVCNLETAHAIAPPHRPSTLRSGLPSWFKSIATRTAGPDRALY